MASCTYALNAFHIYCEAMVLGLAPPCTELEFHIDKANRRYIKQDL